VSGDVRDILILSGRHGYASYLSFSVINTPRNPSLPLFSGAPVHMSRRALGDIFRDTDSVSYQTAEDQLSMSYTFHYKKEELEMNEGVGRARIEGERWRSEPLAWMMSLHHNETLSSLAIIIYLAAYYLNGFVPYSVCGK